MYNLPVLVIWKKVSFLSFHLKFAGLFGLFSPSSSLSLPLFSKIISVTCCPWLVILCTGLVYDSEREVSKFEENETFFGLIMMHTPWSGSSQVFLIWKNLLEILASAITPCFGPLWIEFI